jgi:hypothetical protein
MADLTTLSRTQTEYCRAFASVMNEELERMWKEVSIAYFKVLSRYS